MRESDLILQTTFKPDRRKGLFVYGMTLLLCSGGVTISLLALPKSSGGVFVLWLFVFLFCLAALPMFGISLYGLLNAVYLVSREGLRLRWGTREIFIPIEQVEWLRTAESVLPEIHYPRFSWSGIMRGVIHSSDLGTLEFLASEPASILLLATPARIYALSPRDSSGFVRAVQFALESGNISPIEGYSIQPGSFLNDLWEDRSSRGLIAAGVAFNLGLLVVSSLIIPRQTEIILGFSPGGASMPAIPSTSLRLLSALSIVMGLINFFLGINFYRQLEYRILSYLLWGMAGLLPFLLVIAIGIAVR